MAGLVFTCCACDLPRAGDRRCGIAHFTLNAATRDGGGEQAQRQQDKQNALHTDSLPVGQVET